MAKLVVNAVKRTPSDTGVLVDVTPDDSGDAVRVAVEDRGDGTPETLDT